MGKYSTYLDLQHLCFAPAVELVVQHGEVGIGLGVRPPGHVSNPLLALSLYLLFPARNGRRVFVCSCLHFAFVCAFVFAFCVRGSKRD
jgi:hypothetical protein